MKTKECHKIEKEMRDAYWGAKDTFEHDIRELFGQYISPEEFEAKWRPRLNDPEKLWID